MSKLVPGKNDLASKRPDLAEQWHPTKNDKITAEMITAGSQKKVWWIGPCGHEWKASVCSRSQWSGCPICGGKRISFGHNDLATTHPSLAAQWHPIKNSNLTAQMVTHGSNKKVWWKCEKGHEWQAAVCDRTKGNGCPYCSGYKAWTGFNDLATVKPAVAAEWHPTKNGDLTPQIVTAGSKKKVWWQCKQGHEWEAAVSNRSAPKNPSGCPICAGQRTFVRYNDLASVRPELVTEWHPTKNGELTPQMVTAGSNKKVWWQCEKGHEWQATVGSRNKGCGCPACRGEFGTSLSEQTIFFYLKQVIEAFNRYKFNDEKEFDIWIPEKNIAIEYDGYWHKDAERDLSKNQYCANIGIRLIRIREPGLPELPVECIVLKNLEDNSLEKAIVRLLGILECDVDVDIKRDRNAIYEQYIKSVKENSLAKAKPDVAKQWHPSKNGNLTPEMVTGNSHKNVWWTCKKGHEWEMPVYVKKRSSDCPYCFGHKVWSGFNDLASLNPSLVAEWHPTKNGELTPEMVTGNSHKSVWWKCEKGHEWQAVVYQRHKGTGCPVCNGRLETLDAVSPSLASEWHPTKNGELTPQMVTAGSNKKVWWKCEKGHEWEAPVSRRANGTGCPCCAGRKVLRGFNDLGAVKPELAAQWHPTKNRDLTPQMVTHGSGKKVWWQCEKGHEWQAVIRNRTHGANCPYCSRLKKRDACERKGLGSEDFVFD